MRRLGLVLLVFTAFALDLPARHETGACGTTRDTASESLFLHRQSLRGRLKRAALAASLPPADRDIGNIAIIEDSGGVVEKLNQFNLDGSSVTFAPSTPLATTYRYTFAAGNFEPAAAAQGAPLIALDDDDARQLALPFVFPFFGAVYRSVWVNSDGNLTFLAPDYASTSRSTGRMTGGPPRIAPLFDDLDPSRTAGGVRMFADSAHAVFTWVAVPEWAAYGPGAPQTFQAKLYPDGRIVFTYSGATPSEAVIGIAPGAAQQPPALVSFKNDPSGDYSTAVVERFGDSLEIDIVLAAQRFFANHEDAYDYLVIYNNANVNAASGAVAYESTVRSAGSGWGVPAVDAGAQYGSSSRLRSVINMGQLAQYPTDPNGIVPLRAPARDTPLTVIGHEAGHLFLALASVPDPKDPSARPMLGYGGVHWSFVFNSEASLDEGERIADLGPAVSPRFVTTDVTQGYSPLDQYLMGFRPPADVPPTFLVTDYPPGISPVSHPYQNASFNGNRLDVTVDDLIRAEGRRTPDSTVAQRRFRFAFVMVVPSGSEVPVSDVQQVDAYRQQFEAFFAKASGGNAIADTTLKRSLKLSIFPAAGVIAGGSATAAVTLQTAPRADLTVQLQTAKSFARAPASVVIPAGATSATFSITGVKSGVEELLATPLDPGYETAFARVQAAGASEARLTAISTAPDTVIVRLTDLNDLPYPGARIAAAVSEGGGVTPASAVTDDSGRATFHWSPAAAPENRLQLSVEAAPAVTLTLNAGSAVPAISAVVNAASLAPGMVPGGLATIVGNRLTDSKISLNGSPVSARPVDDSHVLVYVPALTPVGAITVGAAGPSGAATTFESSVVAAQPGIFSFVYRGNYLEIYCTGLGGQTPTVFFNASPVKPVYSGPAPGWTGLDQVNVAIPQGVFGNVTLVISIGNAVSNTIQLTLP